MFATVIAIDAFLKSFYHYNRRRYVTSETEFKQDSPNLSLD